MLGRLAGMETEYVFRFRSRRPGGVRAPHASLFFRLLARLRSRIPVAPAIVGQGCWFLANGGGLRFERLPFYWMLPATGFVEGATPECRGPTQLLRYQRAQDALLSRSAATWGGLDGDTVLLKVSHDGDGHCFGSHENYEATVATGVGLWLWRLAVGPALFVLLFLFAFADTAALLLAALISIPVGLASWLLGHRPGRIYASAVAWLVRLCRTPAQLLSSAFVALTAFRRVRRDLLPFLVTRTVFTGPGMVRPDGRLVLSPRAFEVRSVCGVSAAAWRSVFYFCQLIKAIVDLQAGDGPGFARLFRRRQRLQLTVGDSNMAQHAEYLKVGTTLLVLDVIEAGELGRAPRLRRPLHALRAVSADPDLRTPLALASGGNATALEIQRFYLAACRRFVNRRDPLHAASRQVLDLWGETLEALEHEPARLVGKVDWVTKRSLLDSLGAGASVEERRKLDLRYHELSAEGYYLRLEAAGVAPTIVEPESVLEAIESPPEGSPAFLRGWLIRQAAMSGGEARASWSSVIVPAGSGSRMVRLDQDRR
jgi:proteasome accessory factor A